MLFGFSLIFILCTDLRSAGGGFSAAPAHDASHGHHHDHGHRQCDRQHQRRHYQLRDHHRHLLHEMSDAKMLSEELAEEDNVRLFHDRHRHHGGASKRSGLVVWLHALVCLLLVSFASLICLIILPIIFVQGKPSKAIVDSLALFGAGAMLGDAFLHQLPHVFGGERSHSHDPHGDHSYHAHVGHEHQHSHAHSLEDLSIGLSILAGIVIFLLVEKVVRYVEDNSTRSNAWIHGHHHHHQTSGNKSEDIGDVPDIVQSQSAKGSRRKANEFPDDPLNGNVTTQHDSLLWKRNVTLDKYESGTEDTANGSAAVKSLNQEDSEQPPSNLMFSFLSLLSDGVHNFTDGMALGSAFLLYGSVGGWSRTLFLLVHELPQEVGDFGILVRSGFSVSKALFFHFISALVALAGTAMALLWGQDPGQSSLIEGLTAGGFIYIAVAGVLAEMNNSKTTLRSSAVQITSLLLGMAVALCISLVE